MKLGFEHCPAYAPVKISNLVSKVMFGIKRPGKTPRKMGGKGGWVRSTGKSGGKR